MSPSSQRNLPPPWDRIFSLGTRIFVWGLLASILYLLRPFFLLIFLTFVFAYILNHGEEALARYGKGRGTRTTSVFVVFLGVLLGIGFFVVPQVREQAVTFANDLPEYKKAVDDWINQQKAESPALQAFLADDAAEGEGKEASHFQDMVGQLFGGGEGGKDATPQGALKEAFGVGTTLVGYGTSFLLALLFSFLIVLDLPNIRDGIKGLTRTKIGWIYDEVADNIRDFGKVLGQAMEAQLVIALVNTVLTAIGISLMGLPNVVFLSLIVFLAGFIPVAGVFISSVPICLVALQTGVTAGDGQGVTLLVIAIAMILVVHALEAYVLNPRIVGHKLRMNPVLVLAVLTIAGKLFGVWGMVLGVPIINYVFFHAIRRSDGDAPPIGTTMPEVGSS